MNRIKLIPILALLLSGESHPARAHLNSTPLLVISPSTQAPVQGQALTLNVSTATTFAGYNLFLTATLDGQSLALQHPTPTSWIAVAAPYNSLGDHHLVFSLSVENSESSSNSTKAISAIETRIVVLNHEIAVATDPKVKAALLKDLNGQEGLLSSLEGQLEDLRASVGTQDYYFHVGPNTSNPAFPIVSSISPSSGTVAGGTLVTIRGANFSGGASVLIGAVSATNVVVVDSTTITAVTPELSTPGALSLEVDLPALSGSGVRNSILQDAYYALPVPTPNPDAAPVAITSGSQIFQLGNAAQVDGSQSFDWAGLGLNYIWTFLSTPGGSAFQSGYVFPNASSVSFTPDVYGTYVLKLVVQQASGSVPLSSAPSLAVVNVLSASAATSEEANSDFDRQEK